MSDARVVFTSAMFIGALVLFSSSLVGISSLDVTTPTDLDSCQNVSGTSDTFSCGLGVFTNYIGTATELASSGGWSSLLLFTPLALAIIFVVVKAIIPG